MSGIKVTAKSFAKQLEETGGLFGTVRERIQALLLFALQQYANGNFTYINAIIQSKALKGIAMNGVQKYIESYADVQLVSEGGVKVFKSKKTRAFKFVMPTDTWYEHNNAGDPVAIDVDKAVTALLKRLQGGVEGTGKAKIAKGQLAKAKKAIAVLTPLAA